MDSDSYASGQNLQYLLFTLSETLYGVELTRVREILGFQVPARIPTAPRHIRGLISVRGTTIAVIDLAAKFDLPEAPVSDRTCIALIDVEGHGEEMVLGIIAESVSNIVDLSPEQIEPPPSFGARIRLEFLRGVAKINDSLVFLLDIDRVLSPEELTATAALSAEAAETTT